MNIHHTWWVVQKNRDKWIYTHVSLCVVCRVGIRNYRAQKHNIGWCGMHYVVARDTYVAMS